MTIPASAIAKLAGLGLTADQAAAVAEVLSDVETATAAVHEASKEKARERVAKWRAKQPGNVTERYATSRNGLRGGVTRVEDKTSNSKIEPQKKERTANADLVAFKAALSGVCDEERIDAFVKHRRMKRGAMTAHAARLFLADAEACGMTPVEALDTCISRNWITVKPEFLAGRNQPRAGPANGKVRVADRASALAREMEEADEKLRSSENLGSVRQAIPNLSLVSG